MITSKYKLVALAMMSSLVMMGCGSDSDNDNKEVVNNGDDVIAINIFDTKEYGGNTQDATKRIQWVYKNGDRQLIEKDIIGVNNRKGINNNDKIVLADSFQSVQTKDSIIVKDNIIMYFLKDIKTDRVESQTIEVIPIDLTGITAQKSQTTNLKTDLNYYDKIPNTVSFPKGSLCYVLKQSSTVSLYTFDIDTSLTDYTSLADWEKTYIDVQTDKPLRIEQGIVGSTNQYPVTRIVYNANPVEEHNNYNAINYENAIYEAEYTPKGSFAENADPKNGKVDCTIVNDIAADFLEEQIVKYYK